MTIDLDIPGFPRLPGLIDGVDAGAAVPLEVIEAVELQLMTTIAP